jgi:hypothetical protein
MIIKLALYIFCSIALISAAGVASAQTWKQLDDKTTAFYSAGNIDSAMFYATRELPQAEKEFGKTDSNYYSSLSNLGYLYEMKRGYNRAETFLTQY